MLDFRYHALSLVAVFLALGIGIVLGSSLGDTVVSQANRDIASSLRGDLNGARSDARTAHAAVSARERLLGEFKVKEDELVSLEAAVKAEVNEAVRFADASPPATEESVWKYVYADPDFDPRQ